MHLVPADQFLLQNEANDLPLMLESGRFRVRTIDPQSNVLAETVLTVP
jgi:hypothetical protein